jgi:hypothetical protein
MYTFCFVNSEGWVPPSIGLDKAFCCTCSIQCTLVGHCSISLVSSLSSAALTWRNLPSVFGGYLILKNIPNRKEDGHYAYLRVGGILHLLTGVRSILLLRRRKNHPHPPPNNLHMFRFRTTFSLMLYNGWVKSPWVGDVPKMWAWSQLLPRPKPLVFVNAHTLGFYPTLQLSLVQCVQVDWGIF